MTQEDLHKQTDDWVKARICEQRSQIDLAENNLKILYGELQRRGNGKKVVADTSDVRNNGGLQQPSDGDVEYTRGVGESGIVSEQIGGQPG